MRFPPYLLALSGVRAFSPGALNLRQLRHHGQLSTRPRRIQQVAPMEMAPTKAPSEKDARATAHASSWDSTPVPYSDITVGVPKETLAGERRVAQTPTSVAALTKAGFHVRTSWKRTCLPPTLSSLLTL